MEYSSFYILKGITRSSNKKDYYGVEIEIDEDGSIDGVASTDCTCKFSNSFYGICKHRVAIGLAFLDICRGTPNLIASDEDENYAEANSETSAPLSNYLNKLRDRLNEEADNVRHAEASSVTLIPELEIGEQGYYDECICKLKLRISCNNSKSYVVKNAYELVYNISHNQYKDYGKQLQIKHSYDSLDEDSKKLYCIVHNAVRNDSSNSMYFPYSRSNFSFPEVLLPQLLKIYCDKKLKVNGKQLTIVDENPKIEIRIRKNNDESIQIDIPVFYKVYQSRDA